MQSENSYIHVWDDASELTKGHFFSPTLFKITTNWKRRGQGKSKLNRIHFFFKKGFEVKLNYVLQVYSGVGEVGVSLDASTRSGVAAIT